MDELVAQVNHEEPPPHSRGNAGWVEVIAGSMFSGKSEQLIRRLRGAGSGGRGGREGCRQVGGAQSPAAAREDRAAKGAGFQTGVRLEIFREPDCFPLR